LTFATRPGRGLESECQILNSTEISTDVLGLPIRVSANVADSITGLHGYRSIYIDMALQIQILPQVTLICAFRSFVRASRFPEEGVSILLAI